MNEWEQVNLHSNSTLFWGSLLIYLLQHLSTRFCSCKLYKNSRNRIKRIMIINERERTRKIFIAILRCFEACFFSIFIEIFKHECFVCFQKSITPPYRVVIMMKTRTKTNFRVRWIKHGGKMTQFNKCNVWVDRLIVVKRVTLALSVLQFTLLLTTTENCKFNSCLLP